MNQETHSGPAGSGGAEPSLPPGDSVDLLGFAMRHRRLLAVATAIAACLTAGTLLLTRTLPSTPTTTYGITLTFKGAAQGEYPNKTRFSPQDIIATHLIEGLWKAQGLEESIELADLCRSITIAQSSRELSLLEADYSQKLSNSKLTATERAALEAEFRSKLASLSQSSYTITCVASGLTASQAGRLILAIPTAWASASEARGVTAYEFPLPQSADLRRSAERLASAGSDAPSAILHADMLRSFTEDVDTTIGRLMAVPGGEQTRTASGESVIDLGRRVSALQSNLIMPAYIETMAAAQERNPGEFEAITSVRRRMLEAALKTAQERATVLREALDQVTSESRIAGRDGTLSPMQPDAGIIANVDGTFIDRVIDQAVRSRDVEHRRELSNRVVEAELDVVERQARLDFEEWLMESIAKRRSLMQSADETLVTGSPNRLIQVSGEIAGLADATSEILVQVSERNLNPSSVLYRGDIAPVVSMDRPFSTGSVAAAGAGVWLVLVGVAMAFGAIDDRRAARA